MHHSPLGSVGFSERAALADGESVLEERVQDQEYASQTSFCIFRIFLACFFSSHQAAVGHFYEMSRRAPPLCGVSQRAGECDCLQESARLSCTLLRARLSEETSYKYSVSKMESIIGMSMHAQTRPTDIAPLADFLSTSESTSHLFFQRKVQ